MTYFQTWEICRGKSAHQGQKINLLDLLTNIINVNKSVRFINLQIRRTNAYLLTTTWADCPMSHCKSEIKFTNQIKKIKNKRGRTRCLQIHDFFSSLYYEAEGGHWIRCVIRTQEVIGIADCANKEDR